MKISILTLLAPLLCLAQQPSPSGRSVHGTLRGTDGTALAGGVVSLHRLPPHPPRAQPTRWSTTAGAAGAFQFDGLPAGQYRFCAQVASSLWLNPCEWGKPPAPFSIRADQRASLVLLEMAKGAAVPVRVDDPGQLLPLHEGKTAGAHLLLGVSNDASVFIPARAAKQDGAGRTYEVVIPVDISVKLAVNSSFFQLSDSAGAPLSRSTTTQLPLKVSSGQSPAQVRLIVTGGSK